MTEAYVLGAKFYYTDKSCKEGHKSWRRATGQCITCQKEKNKLYYNKTRDTQLEHKRQQYPLIREKRLNYLKRWRNENREYMSLYQKKRRKYYNSVEAKRRALKLQATFPGHDEAIKGIYRTCPDGWHVDHIIPLRGENVCGLHVPWNLQHLPAEENIRKSNKLLLTPPTNEIHLNEICN